jgi:hypothetical protein
MAGGLLMRKVTVEIGGFNAERGLELVWENDARIKLEKRFEWVVLIANAAGLRTMASHLLSLAETGVTSGHSLHLDDSNGLEPGSIGVILQRE